MCWQLLSMALVVGKGDGKHTLHVRLAWRTQTRQTPTPKSPCLGAAAWACKAWVADWKGGVRMASTVGLEEPQARRKPRAGVAGRARQARPARGRSADTIPRPGPPPCRPQLISTVIKAERPQLLALSGDVISGAFWDGRPGWVERV